MTGTETRRRERVERRATVLLPRVIGALGPYDSLDAGSPARLSLGGVAGPVGWNLAVRDTGTRTDASLVLTSAAGEMLAAFPVNTPVQEAAAFAAAPAIVEGVRPDA